MILKVLLPMEVLIEKTVAKVTAEAENGFFCLLPHHIDFVAALVPGLLSFESDGHEEFLAIDEGMLVKCGAEVLVSTLNAVRGADLGALKEAVEKQFLLADDRQKVAHSAISKLEVSFVKRFIEFEERGHV